MKITAIKPVKYKRNQYSVYVDGKIFMNLDAGTVKKTGISTGQLVNQKELDELAKKDSIYKAKEYAELVLSYRPRSKEELKIKLQKKEFSPEVIEKVLNSLEATGRINDRAFAGWWLKERRRGRPKGDFAVKEELKGKGISSGIIEEVFRKINSEEPVDEVRLAWDACGSMLEKYRKLPKNKARRRLTALLKRRGFSWDAINRVVTDFFS